MKQFSLILFIWLSLIDSFVAHGADTDPNTAAAPRFADANKARYISGELVYIDAVNRRGGIRLDGDQQGRYNSGPPHWFALLPYACAWHLGARAELRDLPLGTHVHGYFVTPPAGEEATSPPLPDDKKQFAMAENHALLIEDDFSFYQRRGQAWKVASIDVAKEKITLEPVAIPPATVANTAAPALPRPVLPRTVLPGGSETGKLVQAGINTSFTFDIDVRSEIWQGRQLVELSAIRPGDNVQFNLAWCQGWGQGEFRVGRLWLDEESRTRATERQRQRHVQYERERWTAGWIDHIEHFDYGGGIVTVTLFDVDQQILDDLSRDREERIAVAVSHKTRRTWCHRADRKFAKLVEWKKLDAPPLGSSTVQLKLKFVELLAGYTPGAIVRVKAENWKFVTMPPEERFTSAGDWERADRMVLPW
ncbi:MAG: hypothetical protein ACKOU6_13200 [Planctomycetota bacterium]